MTSRRSGSPSSETIFPSTLPAVVAPNDPIAGVGVTSRNLPRILAETGAAEIHVVGTELAESPMVYRNRRCFMGTELRSPEYRRDVTSTERVGELVATVMGT